MLVRDLMDPPPACIPDDLSLEEVLRSMDAAARAVMPACGPDGAFAGTVVRRDVLAATADTAADARVAARDVARAELWITPGESVEEAVACMDRHAVKRLPVVEDGILAGTLTPYDISAGLEIESELGAAEERMRYDVAPGDDMFAGSKSAYLSSGLSGLRCIKRGLDAAGLRDPVSILDMPCGHGRVLRYLRALFPEAHIAACDIDLDGVAHCGAAYGAEGISSRDDPADIALSGQFDLIWCGSLLTHLDAPRWPSFLSFFDAHLTPRGVLVFSAHGDVMADEMRASPPDFLMRVFESYVRSGFGYVDYPGQHGYGAALSSREWVADTMADATELEIREFLAAAWDDHHDIYICTRRSPDTGRTPVSARRSRA